MGIPPMSFAQKCLIIRVKIKNSESSLLLRGFVPSAYPVLLTVHGHWAVHGPTGHGLVSGPFVSCPSVFVSCRESPFVNFARPGPDPSTV
ncbi:unnamed protein product [Linum trigynum]|uniref:Uncharacterized protein n=1 Tax=Linum trigynum TaxID=586398 RepID=A0AAV2G1L8_9ROSI